MRAILLAGLALLCGGAYGQQISTPQIRDSAVTTPKIANGAVTAAKLAPGAVPGLTWGSVTGTLANQTDLWAVLNGKAPLVSGLVPTSNLGAGTASASTYLRGDGAWTASNWLTGASPLDASKLTGAVAIANGGTGATTASAARTALGVAGLGANTFTAVQTARGYATTVQTLTDASTITWDASLGANATVTLGGNRTLALPTNLTAGSRLLIRVVQDGTGNRTLAFASGYKFPGAVAPVISNTAGSVTYLEFISWDGTNMSLTNAVFDVR